MLELTVCEGVVVGVTLELTVCVGVTLGVPDGEQTTYGFSHDAEGLFVGLGLAKICA